MSKIVEKIKPYFEFILAPLLVGVILYFIGTSLDSRVQAVEIKQDIYLNQLEKIEKKLDRIACRLGDKLSCDE